MGPFGMFVEAAAAMFVEAVYFFGNLLSGESLRSREDDVVCEI